MTETTDIARSGIQIRNLYKIFGPHPERYIDAVKKGMTKEELNDRHNHVLGLQNISLDLEHGLIPLGIRNAQGHHLILELAGVPRTAVVDVASERPLVLLFPSNPILKGQVVAVH